MIDYKTKLCLSKTCSSVMCFVVQSHGDQQIFLVQKRLPASDPTELTNTITASPFQHWVKWGMERDQSSERPAPVAQPASLFRSG